MYIEIYMYMYGIQRWLVHGCIRGCFANYTNLYTTMLRPRVTFFGAAHMNSEFDHGFHAADCSSGTRLFGDDLKTA